MFIRKRTATLLFLLVATFGLASAWTYPAATVDQSTLLLKNFAPMGYDSATGEVIGNRKGSDGAYNTFAVNPTDATKIRSLTAGNSLYGTENTHRGVSDVSPDGKYMLVEVERPDHFPCFNSTCVHASEAEPGKGAYNQVWLATTDGTRAWPLTNIDADHAQGTFWARFDTTGTRIVLAEILHPASWSEYFGGEQLVAAKIVWNNGAPSMTDRVNLGNPSLFNEPYGYTPDGSAIVANSDVVTPGNPMGAKIMLFPMDGSAPRQLTTSLGTGYQEFAFLRPDHTGYVIGSGYKGWFNGTDRWLVKAASPNSTPTRVTHFADYTTGNPQSGISGGMAFVDNTKAVVGFTKNGIEDAYVVPVP